MLLTNITFDYVSAKNLERSKIWHGDTEWSLSDWAVALAGETGELCNIVKKLNRIRDNLPGNKEGVTETSLKMELAREIADVYLYLDLFATQAGVDIPATLRLKFNETSERLGCKVML